MEWPLIGSICLIGLAVAGAASGEGTGGGVLLRYHFQPGEEFRYRVTVNGNLGTTASGMTPPPGVGVPRATPSTVTGSYELVEKVAAVSPDGAATVSVAIDKMDTTTLSDGIKWAVRLGADGKLETRMNGQPIPPPRGVPDTLPRPLYEMKLDPTGGIRKVMTSSPAAMSRLFGDANLVVLFNSGLPGMGMLMLPEKPVKAGDTWVSQREVQVPMAMPGSAGGGPGGAAPGTPLTLKTTFHSTFLRIEKGRAVIETQVRATALPGARTSLSGGARISSGAATTVDEMNPPMTFVCADAGAIPLGVMTIDRIDQSTTGTERFNIEQGVIEGGDNEMRVTIAMAIGLALRAGVDGTLKTKIERLATAPATALAEPHTPQ